MEASTKTFEVASVLIQLRKALLNHSVPAIDLPYRSTIGYATQRIASHLEYDATPFVLRNQEYINSLIIPSSSLISPQAIRTKEIDTDIEGPLNSPAPIPPRLRGIHRQEIQRYKENIPPRPPHLEVTAGLHDAFLPTLNVSLRLEHADDDEIYDQISPMNALIDTGAHHSYISDNLLGQRFRSVINSREYKAVYGSGSARRTLVQAAVVLQFSNSAVEHTGIAQICPLEQMPNGYNGIILGQHSILNCMELTYKPKRILEAKRIQVAPNSWGRIEVHTLVDSAGEADYV